MHDNLALQVSKKTTGSAPGASSKPSVMDLLVMENVLYAANTSRIYDLKGSERSRWAHEDPAQSGVVLMDDNLRENNLTQPILVSFGRPPHVCTALSLHLEAKLLPGQATELKGCFSSCKPSFQCCYCVCKPHL